MKTVELRSHHTCAIMHCSGGTKAQGTRESWVMPARLGLPKNPDYEVRRPQKDSVHGREVSC